MSDNNIDEGQMTLVDLEEILVPPVEQHDGDDFGAEADDHPEDVRDGVYMLVVRRDGDEVNATPVLFTMGESGAEPLEDAPDDANVFCEMVFEDMADLLVQLINRVENNPGMSKADAMLQLLVDMQEQPQELIHNMLASVIVEAAAEHLADG